MPQPLTRRQLLVGSAAALGSVCLCGASRGEEDPCSTCCTTPDLEPRSVTLSEKSITVDLAKATSLKKVGSAAYLVDKSRGLELILVHSDRNRYAALSRLCTHAERHVSYIRTRRVLMCNNANHSVFGLDGQVVKGPAPKPLRCYAVKVSKNRLDIAI